MGFLHPSAECPRPVAQHFRAALANWDVHRDRGGVLTCKKAKSPTEEKPGKARSRVERSSGPRRGESNATALFMKRWRTRRAMACSPVCYGVSEKPYRDSGVDGKSLISRSPKRFKQGAMEFFRPSPPPEERQTMVHEGAHVGLRNDLSVEAMEGRDRLHSPDSTVSRDRPSQPPPVNQAPRPVRSM